MSAGVVSAAKPPKMRMKTATANLEKASHKLAEAMYAQQGANANPGSGQQQGGGQQSSGSSKDDVIEAEVVDEKK